MDEGISADWPSQEEDEVEETLEASDVEEEQLEITESEVEDDSSNKEDAPSTDWSFPVRAAPILALQGETVTEFPLSQHVSGHQSTSLIVDENLMRIVESRYDEDGIRRLNVRMALVKEHISGYSHTHLDIFQRLMPIWYLSAGFGALAWILMFTAIPVIGGGMFILAGLTGILLAKLDLHRISFSDHGGRHDFYLSGWRQEPYLIYNSTALLGPAFVGFLRNGELETKHIDVIVQSMAKPNPPAAPAPQQPKQLPAPPEAATAPMPLPPQPMIASGPPTSKPQANPIPQPPAPTQIPPPPVAPAPAPPQILPLSSLPPPPMPPPVAPVNALENDPLWD
ncbi:MAG: hypothetical protein CMA10_00520 [Euryarchaeota archaeon]|nr:hypothetical protein [Euryarchaeota archaeon]